MWVWLIGWGAGAISPQDSVVPADDVRDARPTNDLRPTVNLRPTMNRRPTTNAAHTFAGGAERMPVFLDTMSTQLKAYFFCGYGVQNTVETRPRLCTPIEPRP